MLRSLDTEQIGWRNIKKVICKRSSNSFVKSHNRAFVNSIRMFRRLWTVVPGMFAELPSLTSKVIYSDLIFKNLVYIVFFQDHVRFESADHIIFPLGWRAWWTRAALLRLGASKHGPSALGLLIGAYSTASAQDKSFIVRLSHELPSFLNVWSSHRSCWLHCACLSFW